MASGSSGRAGNSGSKGFDFGSDDILCSYEDYGNQDEINGPRPDSSMGVNSNKEFHKSRIARTSVFPTTTYSQPEESTFNQDVILTIEKTMKKHTEDLMRFLEGISSRLSQLELYCYNLDKSVGEMRSDLVRDHDESESKLKSMEKHIQEVHRSVQILRDKQELADTQKELAKLQFAQKESSSSTNTVRNEEKVPLPSSEEKKSENLSDVKAQQLAIVPHQVAPQSSPPIRAVEYQQPPMAPPSSMPSQTVAQMQPYNIPPQIPNQPAPPQPQYLPMQSQHPDLSRVALPPTPSQLQEYSRIAMQQTQPQVNQSPQAQPLPPYQQQQQQQQQQPQPQPQQPPSMHPHIRSPSPPMYSPNLSNQPSVELTANSMPMQVPYTGASQPGSVGSEAISYVYGATGRPIQQQQPSAQNFKPGFASPGTGYMIFEGEGGRMHHAPPPQPHFQPGAYPPASMALNPPQRLPSANMMTQQSTRSHPYNELIEKMVTMGYRGDHVVGVIQRLEESGQPIDFNAVLDRLNGHPSGGGSQRGWSG